MPGGRAGRQAGGRPVTSGGASPFGDSAARPPAPDTARPHSVAWAHTQMSSSLHGRGEECRPPVQPFMPGLSLASPFPCSPVQPTCGEAGAGWAPTVCTVVSEAEPGASVHRAAADSADALEKTDPKGASSSPSVSSSIKHRQPEETGENHSKA